VEKCFVFWREKQSAISETYGTNMHMRVTHRFEIAVAVSNVRCVYHPEGTKCLIIGIIRTVTEAYESHRLLSRGLEAPKRHGKNTAFLSICILLIFPSVIINNKDLLKTR